ncbi:MAG: glycosyl hydrolase family 28-related protein [Phycisphaerae bacterium]
MLKVSQKASGGNQQTGLWDVRDFGAVGDGRHKDTQAIQSAINACAASGGGIVRKCLPSRPPQHHLVRLPRYR